MNAWFAERRVKFNHTKPTRFSSHSDYLVARYNMNKYPTAEEIKQMAQVTQLTEKQVSTYSWLINFKIYLIRYLFLDLFMVPRTACQTEAYNSN